MKYFDDVAAAFKATDADIDQRILRAVEYKARSSSFQAIERWDTVNRLAYFLLLFSQLEAEVNQLCQDLIRQRRASPVWAERRAWDILEHSDDRLRSIPFLNRVALLTDKGGTVYKRVKQLYEIRNKIAHGDLQIESLDVAQIAKDIERIAVSLKGVP